MPKRKAIYSHSHGTEAKVCPSPNQYPYYGKEPKFLLGLKSSDLPGI